MYRTSLRALLMGSIVAGLLLGAIQPRYAVAEEEATPEPEGIEWVAGWDAGRAQAAKDGKIIFLYFGRHSPR